MRQAVRRARVHRVTPSSDQTRRLDRPSWAILGRTCDEDSDDIAHQDVETHPDAESISDIDSTVFMVLRDLAGPLGKTLAPGSRKDGATSLFDCEGRLIDGGCSGHYDSSSSGAPVGV